VNDKSLALLTDEIIACRRCPRLVAWREQVAHEKRRAYRDWEYWGKPVPGFGDPAARVLGIGLAPGAHGSNRTGRMFTGDASGDFLYPALYRAGFANQAHATDRQDGLVLTDLYITAAGRCAPPDNKPTPDELDRCFPYLQQEAAWFPNLQVVVALGRVAFERALRLYPARPPDNGQSFAHGACLPLDEGLTLVASYHPSRQNTQTGRLTSAMFDAIWARVRSLLH